MRNQQSIPARHRTRLIRLLGLLSLLGFPAATPAQFIFATNNEELSLTAYTDTVASVTIPATVDGLPVTGIGASAFAGSSNLTSVTIPANIASIDASAFAACPNLAAVYFQGNSPTLSDSTVFSGDSATIYYADGTTGWGPLFGGLSTILLNPQSLRVTITPGAAVATGAKWAVDGGAWQNSGGIVPSLSVGDHTVSFNSLAGWTSPSNQTVTITPETGTAAIASYTFVDDYGLVTNGGFETGDFSGWTLVGDAHSAFADDGTQTGVVPHSGRNEAALGQVGSLGYLSQTVATSPGANYLVSFRVNCDGQSPNRFSASWNGVPFLNLTNLPALAWTNVQLLVSAAEASSVLEFGFQDDKSYLELDEVRVLPAPDNAGALQVTILPAGAVTSGAEWQVDGGDLQPNGTHMLGLSVGTHTVSFTTVSGWTKPADQVVTIKNGQSAAATGLYTFVPTYGLVTNGGFQTGNFSGWTLNGDPTASFVDDGSLSGITPQSDRYAAALGEVGSLGHLSQTITTKTGENYLLSFWVNSDGLTPNRFVASWNGTTLVDVVDFPAVGWTNMQFLVSATATSSTLQFGFRDDNSYLGLDNVSVLSAPKPVTLSGVGLANNQFGFTVTGPQGMTVAVEATTNLVNPIWSQVQALTLSNGSAHFSDTQWTNNPTRLFRLRW